MGMLHFCFSALFLLSEMFCTVLKISITIVLCCDVKQKFFPHMKIYKKKIFSIFKMMHRFYVYQIQVIQTSRLSWGLSLVMIFVTIPLSHSLTCSEGSLSRVYPASTLWQVSTSPTSNPHLETWKKMNDRPNLVRNPFLVIISNNHYPVNCYLLTGERTKLYNELYFGAADVTLTLFKPE